MVWTEAWEAQGDADGSCCQVAIKITRSFDRQSRVRRKYWWWSSGRSVRIILDNDAIDDLITGGLLLAGGALVSPSPLLSPFFSASTFSRSATVWSKFFGANSLYSFTASNLYDWIYRKAARGTPPASRLTCSNTPLGSLSWEQSFTRRSWSFASVVSFFLVPFGIPRIFDARTACIAFSRSTINVTLSMLVRDFRVPVAHSSGSL